VVSAAEDLSGYLPATTLDQFESPNDALTTATATDEDADRKYSYVLLYF
jgi:hypothetical protein